MLSNFFSQNGTLVEVDAATKCSELGSSSFGISSSNGVVLVSVKKQHSPLQQTVSNMKQIHDNAVCVYSGFQPDATELVRHANQLPSDYMPIKNLVIKLCRLKYSHTQNRNLRPFAVSLLIAGLDQEFQLYQTDPSGNFNSFKATAIGKNDTIVQNFLAENYHTVSTVNGALYLAGRVLREFQLKLIPDGDLNLVEIVTITHDPKTERGIICQSLNPTQTLELWSRSK